MAALSSSEEYLYQHFVYTHLVRVRCRVVEVVLEGWVVREELPRPREVGLTPVPKL